jgi:hypothetical protein
LAIKRNFPAREQSKSWVRNVALLADASAPCRRRQIGAVAGSPPYGHVGDPSGRRCKLNPANRMTNHSKACLRQPAGLHIEWFFLLHIIIQETSFLLHDEP